MVGLKQLHYAENQIQAIEVLDNMLNSLHGLSDTFDRKNDEMNSFWDKFDESEEEIEEQTGFFSKYFSSGKKEIVVEEEKKFVIIEGEKVTIRTLKEFKQYEELMQNYKELNEIKGLYIYGSPGCGKTFIMDMFYKNCNLKRKKRTHFNRFMLEVHVKLHKLKSMVYRYSCFIIILFICR